MKLLALSSLPSDFAPIRTSAPQISLDSSHSAQFSPPPAEQGPIASAAMVRRAIAAVRGLMPGAMLSLAVVLGAGDAGLATTFRAPGEAAPQQSLGGGVRGQTQFSAPGAVAPSTSLGGGTRGAVQFTVPGQLAPSNSQGGGTRGAVQFTVPGQLAPSNSQGGGTRGVTQFAAPGQVAPRNSLGGGSRGVVQFALPGQAAPRSSTSGGTRTAEVVNWEEPTSSMEAGATPESIALAWNLPQNSASPLALVPNPQQISYTLAARPTFFVYLPPIGAEEVLFSLQNEAGESVYHTQLAVPVEGGIIRFTLPEDAPELALNQNYVWFFVPIEPGASLRPDSPAAVAWIKRVESPLAADTVAEPTIDRAVALAEAGIWHDTLALISAEMEQEQQELRTVASPHGSDATFWSQEWQDLLEAVGLLQSLPH